MTDPLRLERWEPGPDYVPMGHIRAGEHPLAMRIDVYLDGVLLDLVAEADDVAGWASCYDLANTYPTTVPARIRKTGAVRFRVRPIAEAREAPPDPA